MLQSPTIYDFHKLFLKLLYYCIMYYEKKYWIKIVKLKI